MTNMNAEQSQRAIGNSLVVLKNEASIKGIDYSEIEGLLNVIDLFNLDQHKQEVNLIRFFVKELHANLKKRNSVKTEIINGLLKTKDDYTFISYVSLLREGLWN